MFLYNLKRETWLNNLLDVNGSNDQQFFAHTLLIDCGSLGISRSCLQLIISSTTNLVKLLMCLGMVTIFVWDRYRYFQYITRKYSGFKKNSKFSYIFTADEIQCFQPWKPIPKRTIRRIACQYRWGCRKNWFLRQLQFINNISWKMTKIWAIIWV